jgi:hypothetical protein
VASWSSGPEAASGSRDPAVVRPMGPGVGSMGLDLTWGSGLGRAPGARTRLALPQSPGPGTLKRLSRPHSVLGPIVPLVGP